MTVERIKEEELSNWIVRLINLTIILLNSDLEIKMSEYLNLFIQMSFEFEDIKSSYIFITKFNKLVTYISFFVITIYAKNDFMF